MSKRRQPGERIRKKPNAGFVGEAFVGIIDPECEPDSPPCHDCGDPDCQEWATVLSEDGLGSAYHVCECEMEDA